jgi:hypothetical protein
LTTKTISVSKMLLMSFPIDQCGNNSLVLHFKDSKSAFNYQINF